MMNVSASSAAWRFNRISTANTVATIPPPAFRALNQGGRSLPKTPTPIRDNPTTSRAVPMMRTTVEATSAGSLIKIPPRIITRTPLTTSTTRHQLGVLTSIFAKD